MAAVILIVDDSAVVRALHADIPGAQGHVTLQADNGFAALEALHRRPCGLARAIHQGREAGANVCPVKLTEPLVAVRRLLGAAKTAPAEAG